MPSSCRGCFHLSGRLVGLAAPLRKSAGEGWISVCPLSLQRREGQVSQTGKLLFILSAACLCSTSLNLSWEKQYWRLWSVSPEGWGQSEGLRALGLPTYLLALSQQKDGSADLESAEAVWAAADFGKEVARSGCPEATPLERRRSRIQDLSSSLVTVARNCLLPWTGATWPLPHQLFLGFSHATHPTSLLLLCSSRAGAGERSQKPMLTDHLGFFLSCWIYACCWERLEGHRVI